MTENPQPPRPHDEPEAPSAAPAPAAHEPAPIDLATESVAGEEDPGASIDLVVAPAAPTPPPVRPG